MIRTSPLASLALMFSLSLAACGDDANGEGGESGTGTDTADTGTSDEIGDSGSTTSTSTTSTDETTTTTTTSTDEGNCPVGAEGCPCTGGGGCDPGLVCEGDVCTQPADTSADTSTTDMSTTDTGNDPMPYQACPNGDGDCAPGEVCVMGAAMMGQVPWTMCTSGECNGDDDCAVDDNDSCNDLPGDGQPIDYCVPFECSDNNPCPDSMVCVAGFGGGTSVCVWPL